MVGMRTSVVVFAILRACLAARPLEGHASHGRFHVVRELGGDQAETEVENPNVAVEHAHRAYHSGPAVAETELVYPLEELVEAVGVKVEVKMNTLKKRASSATTSSSTKASSSTKTSSSIKTQVLVASVTTTKATTTSYVNAPTAGNVTIHGVASSSADMRYVPSQKSASLPVLQPLETSTPGPNPNLTLNYPIFNGTGSLTILPAAESLLQPLKWNPLLSRDGGKGGVINGVRFFIFADTSISSPANGTKLGAFEGFVSNSIAVDVGLNAVKSKPLLIQDGAGEWTNNVGTMRNWVPLTTGEQRYNQLFQNKGQRYGIWPTTSTTALTNDTAVMWAPIIYSNINTTAGTVTFPYVGSTQIFVTVPNAAVGGPVAERTVPMMWGNNDVEWGCVGGIRSWGPSGVGGTDGKVYIFGVVTNGLLLARVDATNVKTKSKYEYYAGGGNWSAAVPSKSSTAYFTKGAFSTVDIFYSAKYKTFIMVYMTYYTDNSFYWRYLKAPKPLVPGYLGGDQADFVEAIYTYSWSADYLLFKAPVPSSSYNYGGGVHQGYYGANDITSGGSRMLVTWTHPTGLNAASASTGYQLISAEINWS